MFDLVAIGNPVYDEIITPLIRTEGRVLSGCSTNACLAAKKLGLEKVALIGSIGKDHEAPFKAHMAKYSIALPRLKVSEHTGGFKLIYDPRGDRTLDVLGVADPIFPEDIPKECLEAEIILIAPILQETSLDLIRFLRAHSHATLFLDPQGVIREIGKDNRIVEKCERHFAAEVTSLVDIIKPNEHEAILLTSCEDPYTASRQLIEWGAKISIITLADRGSVIRREKGSVKIPAYKTIAKDPTGAGDTYAGAFIKRYLQNEPLLSCGLYASAAASIKVEHTGPDFPLSEDAVIQRAHALDSP